MDKPDKDNGAYSPVSRSENDSEEAESFLDRLESATRYNRTGHHKLTGFKNCAIVILFTLLTATNIACLVLLLRRQQGQDHDDLETTRYYCEFSPSLF